MSCDFFSFTYGPFIFHQVEGGGLVGFEAGGHEKMALRGGGVKRKNSGF